MGEEEEERKLCLPKYSNNTQDHLLSNLVPVQEKFNSSVV